MIREGITYDDVLILPAYSDIPTRDDIDVRSRILGGFRLPIISAPMDTVSGPAMVTALWECGAYGVLHRFSDFKDREEDIIEARKYNLNSVFGVSIGVKDWPEIERWLDSVQKYKIHSICIDVAHGHHGLVGETITNLKEWSVKHDIAPYIIAGNVATAQGFIDVAAWGADAVRVGIGPGSACTTRTTTGVGVPQLTALMDVVDARLRRGYNDVSIIADGGIQHPGDIAKALAVGADAVMLGKMLAGADESNAKSWGTQKIYRGQSTVGSNGSREAPEGITGAVDASGPVSATIKRLEQYLKSSFSYVGARNLTQFRENVEFIRVSPSTHLESGTRLLNV